MTPTHPIHLCRQFGCHPYCMACPYEGDATLCIHARYEELAFERYANRLYFSCATRPRPLQRARNWGGKTVDTAQNRERKHTVALIAALAMKQQHVRKLLGPLFVRFVFVYKAVAKHKPGDLFVSPGDGSNCQKLIEDALNLVAWHDDKQIAWWQGVQVWGEQDEVKVTIVEVEK